MVNKNECLKTQKELKREIIEFEDFLIQKRLYEIEKLVKTLVKTKNKNRRSKLYEKLNNEFKLIELYYDNNL